MNKELSDKLYNEYKELYKDYKSFPEVGDGWYELLSNLSRDLYDLATKEEIEVARVLQIKEKFGTLRFYVSYTTDEMDEIIHKYENLSGETCEDCGSVGDIAKSTGGWIRTVCKQCTIKNKLKRL